MKKYFLSRKSSIQGYYPVHKEDCPFMPEPAGRIYLGEFENSQQAVETASILNLKSDGCYFCSAASSNCLNKRAEARPLAFSIDLFHSRN